MEDLKEIKIEDSKFVYVNQKKFMYTFCKKNDLKNLYDFVMFYENNKELFYAKPSHEEVMGLVDLIQYKYLKKDLNIDKFLFLKFTKNYKITSRNYCTKDIYDDSCSNVLRRMGFTVDEAMCLRYYVEKTEFDGSLIDVLKKYRRNNCGIKLYCSKEEKVFFNKLDIILEYYKNKFDYDISKDLDNSKISKLIDKLYYYLSKKEEIEKSLKNIYNELNDFNLNDEDIKMLIKSRKK